MLETFNLDKIQQIAKTYSPQELFAALIWQRQFNNFDGKQIINDLFSNQDLWHSFLFSKAIYDRDEEGLSFSCMVTTLLAMANYRSMPETSNISFVAYPADTLYVLTENEHTLMARLIDLGKKWQADSVEIVDGSNKEYSYYTQYKLKESLINKDKIVCKLPKNERKDAVVVAYWWD